MSDKDKLGYSAIASFLVGFLLTGQTFAQVPPVPSQDPTRMEDVHVQQGRDRIRIEQQIQQATAPLPTVRVTSPQVQPSDIEGQSRQKTFKLNQVVFDPIPRSVSLSELDAITAPYTAMDMVSMYDLYCMVLEIDALFDRRHVLGRAVLPVQDIDGGVVTVQIVEGREGRRIISTKAPPCLGFGDSPFFPMSGHRLFGQQFVQKQFRFSGRQVFNIQALEDEILRYNRTFRSQLVAEIEPGGELGQSTLKLTRIMPQPVSGGYYVDNSGRESSGRIRDGGYLNFSDILGLNESYFVSYDKTEGTSSLSMSGDIPVSRRGTFFEMSYYYGEPKTIAGPFAILEINGISEQYRPGLRQILVNKKERRLDATLHYQNYSSQTYFGPHLNYEELHDAMSVGLEYSHRKNKTATFAGISVIYGGAKTMAPPIATQGYVQSDFCLMKMNLMRIWYPNPKWTLILRGSGSAAFSDLPQSQVFQIGGMNTVRGTPEGMMSGDSGYLVTTEARRLIWSGCGSKSCCSDQCGPRPCDAACGSIKSRKSVVEYFRDDWRKHSRVEAFTFIDHGGIFHRRSDWHSSAFLTSIGVGGTVNLGRHTSLSGGYGQPIFREWSRLEEHRALLRYGNAFFTAKVMF
ncbi:MAG: hypothetical protein FWE95_09280 [Planctomycetaceae bacterium]|nr:hypothetical protein [Planctomycetaceae bacterium]